MEKSLIDTTIKRIGKGYKPGTLARMKRQRPGDWKRMVELETEINRFASQRNEIELVRVLNLYETFMLTI